MYVDFIHACMIKLWQCWTLGIGTGDVVGLLGVGASLGYPLLQFSYLYFICHPICQVQHVSKITLSVTEIESNNVK